MPKFNIDASEDIKLLETSLDALQQTVISRARARGFIPFARPRVPEVVKPFIECVHQGYRMFLNDRRLEGVDLEDLELVPPADVSKLDIEMVGHLIQYFSAELAFKSCELVDLEYVQAAAKMKMSRLQRMVEMDLRGQKDPATGRKYSDKARTEQAKSDARVLHAEEVYLLAQSTYKRAQALYDGWRRVVEALNRNRMAKMEEAQRSYHSPGYENDYNPSAERTKARASRWKNKGRT